MPDRGRPGVAGAGRRLAGGGRGGVGCARVRHQRPGDRPHRGGNRHLDARDRRTHRRCTARRTRDCGRQRVVGSNVFNILAVLGVTGLVSNGSLPVSEAARNFDLWVMLAVAFACLPIMISGREIARWEGDYSLPTTPPIPPG